MWPDIGRVHEAGHRPTRKVRTYEATRGLEKEKEEGKKENENGAREPFAAAPKGGSDAADLGADAGCRERSLRQRQHADATMAALAACARGCKERAPPQRRNE